MIFNNEFEVEGPPSRVFELLADVRLMAQFLPGAAVGEQNPDGSHPAQLVVSFGPKRLTFKGTLTSSVQRETLSGVVEGRASADARGAKMSVVMGYTLADMGQATRVKLVSEAELTGMLAEFARAGGATVAQALIDEFATRLSSHISQSNNGRGSEPRNHTEVAGAGSAASPLPAGKLMARWLLSRLWPRALRKKKLRNP